MPYFSPVDADISYKTHDGLVAVDRAIAELRRGAMVILHDGLQQIMLLAGEAAGDGALTRFNRLLTGNASVITVSRHRAQAFGLAGDSDSDAVILISRNGLTIKQIEALTNPFTNHPPDDLQKLDQSIPDWADAAIALAKLARLLPILVAAVIEESPMGLYEVRGSDILSYPVHAAQRLRRVAEADVPLADAKNCRIVAFRPSDGGIEHLAIIVGEPDYNQPVMTRLHSECFTGDLLGSLRCDCGEQLRNAIARLAKEGGGVLLYLAQEGRGIGLINKLHAYKLQDQGLDTLDANQHLGFNDDERLYLPAANILKLLGINKIRLLTNNPDKVAALQRYAIEVTERVPHLASTNNHNAAYMDTKARRFGHFL